MNNLALGIMIPFLGTAAGAACVFFMKGQIRPLVQKMLLGFASGVMVAASVWSLLMPSMDMAADMGKFAFVPAAVGFLLESLSCWPWTIWCPTCTWAARSRRA